MQGLFLLTMQPVANFMKVFNEGLFIYIPETAVRRRRRWCGGCSC